jgi:hypothetical protein
MYRPTIGDLEITAKGKDDQWGTDLLSDAFLFTRALKNVWIQISHGLLREDVAFELMGWDVVYWHVLFSRIDASYIEQLRTLESFAAWSWEKATYLGLAAGTLSEVIDRLDSGENQVFSSEWNRDIVTDFGRSRR